MKVFRLVRSEIYRLLPHKISRFGWCLSVATTWSRGDTSVALLAYVPTEMTAGMKRLSTTTFAVSEILFVPRHVDTPSSIKSHSKEAPKPGVEDAAHLSANR